MKSILLEDNPHWINSNCYDGFIPREILKDAINFLKIKEVLALIGAR